MDMSARNIFKTMYRHARKARYVNHLNSFARGQDDVQPQPYMLADAAVSYVIHEKGAPIRETVDLMKGVIWAIHWNHPRPEDARTDVPKWLSERHMNFHLGPDESRVWFQHPGIPGVTRPMGETRNAEGRIYQ